MINQLHLVIRTPHEVVLERDLEAVRIPVQSGQVGLRPRQEPLLLPIEAGLILMHSGGSTEFVATAGGLVEGDRKQVVIYTPFAIVGREQEVLPALDQALVTPDSDIVVRQRLGELEQHIVDELRRGSSPKQRR